MSSEQTEFADFFQASWEPCLRAVAAVVSSPQLAEDQVAEAFAKAWASWPKLRRHPAPRAWVVRTALNTGASWWRRRRRDLPLADHDRTASGDLDGGLDARLLTAIWRLPRRQREVIALRIFLDLDTATIARQLGIEAGTVRMHLSRGVSALRHELTPAKNMEADPVGGRCGDRTGTGPDRRPRRRPGPGARHDPDRVVHAGQQLQRHGHADHQPERTGRRRGPAERPTAIRHPGPGHLRPLLLLRSRAAPLSRVLSFYPNYGPGWHVIPRGVHPTITFNPAAMPAGAELSFGVFQLRSGEQLTDFVLINTSSYTCASTPPQTLPANGAQFQLLPARS